MRAGSNQRVYLGGSVRLVCMRVCVKGERTVRVFGRDVGATVFCLSCPPFSTPPREIVEVCRKGEPARTFLVKGQG